jgi:hypothetical protein
LARKRRTEATDSKSRTVRHAAAPRARRRAGGYALPQLGRRSNLDRAQSKGPGKRQGDSSKAGVFRVAKAAFEGLAPLLVECGITSPEAETLLRAVCAHETAKAYTSSGRRPNVSRVAVKTGLSRQVVSALLKSPPGVDAGFSTRRDSMRRVIDGWLSDPDYTKRERPKDLEIGSPSSKGHDAWTLIQRYAPGVWPRLIIDELIRVDYVHVQSNGRLRWKGNVVGRLVSRRDAPEAAGQRMRDAMRTALHDIRQPESKRTWRTAQSVEIGRSDLPLVRNMLADRLEAMITWLTEELNSQRWRRGVSKGGRMRVGLSGFIFEESLTRDVSIGSDKTNVRTK